MQGMNLTVQINKRNRYNRMLEALREPKTVVELETELNVTPNSYTDAVRILVRLGYVICVGRSTKRNKPRIFKAIKFYYREEGVDYDTPPDERVEVDEPEEIETTLADAHYIHKSSAFRQKYAETAALLRRERKSARVYVSGAQAYASF